MELTLNELLKGKGTKIKEKEFYPTEAYVEPFLNRMEKIPGVNYIIKAELPKQTTITRKDDVDFDDVTYNRVWIQAVLPEEYQVDNHDDVIGMVYGIDTQKPIAKFYRGGVNRACTNLCVFNPSQLLVQGIEQRKPINFGGLDVLISAANDIRGFLNKLHSIPFVAEESFINEQLGMWVRNCLSMKYDNGFQKPKLTHTTAVDAYKLLFENAKSPYYVNSGSNTDMFNVYNAFTEIISNKDKDIINGVEKTLLVKNILNI